MPPEVVTLIGPVVAPLGTIARTWVSESTAKKADVPWKVLEKQGWIATALCTEIRIPLDEGNRLEYAIADPREKFRLASVNPRKEEVIRRVLAHHSEQTRRAVERVAPVAAPGYRPETLQVLFGGGA